MMVVIVVSVVDAIAQQSMASLLSLTRECLLTAYILVVILQIGLSSMEPLLQLMVPFFRNDDFLKDQESLFSSLKNNMTLI
jgi:hypothetical protein